MNPSRVAAIIPAAGSGIRMGLPEPKQFFELEGMPILVHTLRVFEKVESIGQVIVVVPADKCSLVEELVQRHQLTRVSGVVAGGKKRQDSVKAGLAALPPDIELVLVHDGVRPFVPVSVIENCLREAEIHGAAMAGVEVKDTLKSVSGAKIIQKTVSRDNVWQAQTPQAVKTDLLTQAYRLAAEKNDFIATDEAALLELLDHPVKVVEGSEKNIKITRPEDLALAKAIFMEKDNEQKSFSGKYIWCSGYGYDAHRLVSGRPLVLGGETIPHDLGLQGHSDADVIIHALCDAILGAAGAGDIGRHFPDTDPKLKDISSMNILAEVMALISAGGYLLGNADITVVAQKPKLAPFFGAMKKNIGAACGVMPDRINLKATTTEEMGFEGRGEGISAHAVVMLKKLSG